MMGLRRKVAGEFQSFQNGDNTRVFAIISNLENLFFPQPPLYVSYYRPYILLNIRKTTLRRL